MAKKVGRKKKVGRGKLTDKQKLSCLVPVKMTPSEYKKFMKIAKDMEFTYISQLARKVFIDFIDLYDDEKDAVKEAKKTKTFLVDSEVEGEPV